MGIKIPIEIPDEIMAEVVQKAVDKRLQEIKQEGDFVIVTRCKDCKNWCANYCTRDIKGRTNMFFMNADDFCSYAEQKEIEGSRE